MREFGSEHPAVVLPDGYFDNFSLPGRETSYLRSGREALMMSAIAAGGNGKIILIPAYCCWSMSVPFERCGWKVVYYRLNEDLTVNIGYLRHLMYRVNADAVLTMNFFGSACTEKAVKAVKEYDRRITVIEDFSHCTFSFKHIFNPDVDIYVSSIRKSVGICDGAVIISRIPLPMDHVVKSQPEFWMRRHAAQTEKGHYAFMKNQDRKAGFLFELRECEHTLDAFTSIHSISRLSRMMLFQVNGEEIAFARRENMRRLMGLLQEKVNMVPGLERCLDGAPFSLPILVENQLKVQSQLAKRGLYTQVLWPICREAGEICATSRRMGSHMLSVPIDQRYNADDMEDMARILKEVIDT